jgi:predicted cobalt transporter CbtA
VLVFGLAYYFLEPALPGRPDTQSYLLAGAGFLTVSGAPWLALPPQPPGVEQALPTETRIIWYGALMLTGVITSGAAIAAYSRLANRYGQMIGLAGGVLPLLSLGAIVLVVPANPTTSPAPDVLVAAFRWTVVAGQLGLWIVLAGSHTWFLRRDRAAATEPDNTGREPEWLTTNQ